MALIAGNTVTTAGTGGSDSIRAPADAKVMCACFVVWAGSAGDADLQYSYDGTNWVDATDSSGVINITSEIAYRVPGGLQYRLDVNTHTSAATMTLVE